MRVLVLVEQSALLETVARPDRIGTLDDPSPQRDLAFAFPALDPLRIQVSYLALDQLGTRRRWSRKGVSALADHLRSAKIELVHALGMRPMVYAVLASQMAELPAVASLYDYLPWTSEAYRFWWGLAGRFINWRIARVIVPSEIVRDNLWRLRVAPERAAVIYPGVTIAPEPLPPPPTNATPPEREALGLPPLPLATVIAPLEEDQAFKMVFEALPILLQRVPNARIAVLGTGKLSIELMRQARLEPVFWLGKRTDAEAIIAASTVVLLIPREPCLPRAALVAAGLARPVVSVRLPGISEAVMHGSTGLLVTLDDVRDFGIQTARLLSQPQFAQTMGTNAHRRAVGRYSITAQVEQLTTLYEEVIYASR